MHLQKIYKYTASYIANTGQCLIISAVIWLCMTLYLIKWTPEWLDMLLLILACACA